MTISAQSIIRRCVDTLQDPTSIRWPVSELVRYLNDAQREVVVYRPDAATVTVSVPCVGGAKQALPTNGLKLLSVLRNTSGAKRAVRLVSREILDAQTPGWQGLPGVTELLHYTYDPRDPKVFYVYPPAVIEGASLEVMYSATPTDVSEPADGSTWSAVTGNLSIPDIYANVVVDYILYRAYMKDSEYAGNAARAQSHYAAFANALGIEMKATISMSPVGQGNPGVMAANVAG